jgi:cobalt-zinc-cadmium efflux system membrane fusion protein
MKASTIGLVALLAACSGRDKAVPAPAAEAVPVEANTISVSAEVIHEAGITIMPVTRGLVPEVITLTGEVAADPNQQALLSVKVGGRVASVTFQEGQQVSKGQVLAVVESTEVTRIRGDLGASNARRVALQQRVARLAELVKAGTATAQDLENTRGELAVLDAEVSANQQTLAGLGAGGAARLELRSPIAGVVVKRNAIVGQPVSANDVLGEIVDLSKAVFVARLFEHDLMRVPVGAPARVEFDVAAGMEFVGVVDTIGRQVDPIARAVLARIAIVDQKQFLKIGLLGTASVAVSSEKDKARPAVIVVPSSAVTRVDDRPVVFVATGANQFVMRDIELGHSAFGQAEVLKGLVDTDKVANAGTFTLKSLALKATFSEEE